MKKAILRLNGSQIEIVDWFPGNLIWVRDVGTKVEIIAIYDDDYGVYGLTTA